jgi:biotin synthase
VNNDVVRLAESVLEGKLLDRSAGMKLLEMQGPDRYDLFYWANRIRERFHGRKIHLCAIVSARQGACPEDCAFCAQSARYGTPAAPHPMLTAAEIVSAGERAKAAGAHCFGIVTSGRSARAREKDLEVILDAARTVKSRGVSVGAALGELDPETAATLKAAGVTRYNHNLETSRRHFANICTTHSYEDRRRTVVAAKSAGLQVCCGGIFGVGETPEDRVDLALALRDLEADSVPLNFLNPIPGTPLAGAERLAPLEILNIIAVFRFMLPRQEIKVCGGREVNLRDLQSWMFYAGADGTMVGHYLTTQGRPPAEDLQMLRDLELERG